MRANLLRAVSHDLRTPLTSIIGLADTALSDSPKLTEEKRRELLAGIREDANLAVKYGRKPVICDQDPGGRYPCEYFAGAS